MLLACRKCSASLDDAYDLLLVSVRTVVKYASHDIHIIISNSAICAMMPASPDSLRHIVKYAATRQNAVPGGPGFSGGLDG